MILTSSRQQLGALSVRSVRRLPPSNQWQAATLGIVTGLPWQPKWGTQTSPPFLDLPVQQALQPRTTEERSSPASPAVMAQDGPAERLDFPNLAAEGDAMAEPLEAEQASLSLSLPESPLRMLSRRLPRLHHRLKHRFPKFRWTAQMTMATALMF